MSIKNAVVFIKNGQIDTTVETKPSVIEQFLKDDGMAVVLFKGVSITSSRGENIELANIADVNIRLDDKGNVKPRLWVTGAWLAIYNVTIQGNITRQLLYGEIGDRTSVHNSYAVASNSNPREHDGPVRQLVELAISEACGEYVEHRSMDLGGLDEFMSKVRRAFPVNLNTLRAQDGLQAKLGLSGTNGTTKFMLNGKEIEGGTSVQAMNRFDRRRNARGQQSIGQQQIPVVGAEKLNKL